MKQTVCLEFHTVLKALPVHSIEICNAPASTQSNNDAFSRVTRLKMGLSVFQGWLRLTISVSVPDLRENIGVDYEQVTRILFSESTGFFVGSLLGGILFERFIVYTELIMAAGISCGALGEWGIRWVGY